MSNKHTPGEWIVATSCSWRRIVNSRGEPVCIPCIQRSDNHPDLYFPNGGPEGPDARLIAAAPDMLEALKNSRIALVVFRQQNGLSLGEIKQIDYDISLVDAAIAKAEGRDQ